MITEVDEWEAAESRRQLPGKRRLVEHSVVIPSETAETAAEKAETTPAPEETAETAVDSMAHGFKFVF